MRHSSPKAVGSDNCLGIVTITFQDSAPVIEGCTKTITRTYTATDSCNNVATCTQTITVRDTTKPTISCPPAATVQCDSEKPAGANTVEAFKSQGGSVSDNCLGTVTITFQDSAPVIEGCTKTITRTYTATDSCNNVATCTQTITVRDTTPPVLRGVPADVTVECSNIPTAPTVARVATVATVTATDNCDPAPVVTYEGETREDGTCQNNYILKRTWKATDACRNTILATQIITVRDTTKPTISCPPAATVQCDSEKPAGANTVEAFKSQGGSVSDNCLGIVTITFQDSAPVIEGCTKTITRTYTATDSCNNVATCTQTITVRDTTKPTISCPPAATVQCDSEKPAGANTVEAFKSQGGSVSDNCLGIVTITFQDSAPVIEGCTKTITRTYTATDSCNNVATCTQTITVRDTTKPTISCPPAATVQCDSEKPAGANTVEAFKSQGGSVSDNCLGIVTITFQDSAPVIEGCTKTITRTYTATDSCNNVATCTQTITVQDTTKPTISCPPAATVQCDSENTCRGKHG